MNNIDLITYHIEKEVGIITFNRPPANAYNLEFHQVFSNILNKVDEDTKVNSVIIKSSMENFFCAGADIKEFQNNSIETNQKMVTLARENLSLMDKSSKIFIAEIAGHTMGGGLEIALACDIRFAADSKYLIGMSEIKLGLIPGNGGTQRFARLVGKNKAMEYLLTGENFSSDIAYEIGLINRLFSSEELHTKSLAFALQLSKGPALAIAATKKVVMNGSELSLQKGLELEYKTADELCHSNDAKEGFNAFVEKREAKYTGS